MQKNYGNSGEHYRYLIQFVKQVLRVVAVKYADSFGGWEAVLCCNLHSLAACFNFERTGSFMLAKAASRVANKTEDRELAILELIHSGANYSRLELAHRTGLSPASITAIVRGLIAKELVTESGTMSSATGRKPISLEIRADAGELVGVDIGSF
jgi:hypothetical protein